MLIIETTTGTHFTRYVGDEKTFDMVGMVYSVQADETELMHIIDQCSNLPFTKKRVQKWYGDQAKFIVGNLFS